MNGLMQFLQQNGALVSVLAAIALVFWLARVTVTETEPPYEKRGSLITDTELKFYKALQAAIGGSWTLFTMVRLAEMIQVRSDTPGAQVWRNKIFAKHIDFVLCHNDSLEILLAIELDDASHQRADRIERDKFVDSALTAAGIPIWRVPVADAYEKIALRKQLDELLSGKKKK